MCVWCVWWCVYTHGVCVYMYMCMWCECVCSVVYPDINPTLIATWCLVNGTGYRTYGIAFKDQCECEFRTATAAVTPFPLHAHPQRIFTSPTIYRPAQVLHLHTWRWSLAPAWRFFFSHWRKHSLHQWWCHPLQLALVVFFLPPNGTHNPIVLEQRAL